mmetsp:Transcript_18666/g.48645  ORF Transcript_18666/g.48645 Transcript_18666/m.48645 type:complete len:131 (+) Transcript_18666:133-525(+)|eukprot:CAMPEP_0182928056 /NCGR_PEP_ID=MMETSP0105_2-20130417/15037_1 /TAXON_ID=81532 ORGANISM="Acanthoeca-like sp., Strain 10tr" /NCGR_SAMPLE_ID=MMETSP0105_2 /ASSEMBLY_ACC=CAM_ASM_000205 /LENGTH=130 /DNA_ID=CAMNT_0025066045 /DNA_START=133 /DNA_END=525 /DNA_ORIENTATION=+
MAAGAPETREVMFGYCATATFVGSRHQPCRFLTSECPDRCGHASTVYRFRLDRLDVQPNVESTHAKWVTPVKEGSELLVGERDLHEWREAAGALSDGAKCDLEWSHDYVTVGGASGPDRPVTLLRPAAEL